MRSGKPLVIKADGLSSGKGVFVCNDKIDATMAIQTLMDDKKFGDAGSKIIIEEKLDGYELSLMCFTDSKTIMPMIPIRDYKRLSSDLNSPMTGGMGSVGPIEIAKNLYDKIMNRIVYPTLNGLNDLNIEYKGVLYFGLMINKDENPFVLEYNCRTGDPECQIAMRLIDTNLLEIIDKVIDNKLNDIKFKWKSAYCVNVVISGKNYPYINSIGEKIEKIDESEDIIIFHAGTKLNKNSELESNGGRILNFVGIGSSIEETRLKVYDKLNSLNLENFYFRDDIGL
jgi:phosphoribosylamine--glycine ligase